MFDDVEDADNAMTYTVSANDNTILVPTSGAISGTTLTLNYANSGTGTANITIRAQDTDGNTVTDSFIVNITAGCSSGVGTGTGTFSSVGTCTVIGDNYDVKNNNTVGNNVRIGDGFKSKNNGSVGDGAIVGVNVGSTGSGTTIAAGAIIPDNITNP